MRPAGDSVCVCVRDGDREQQATYGADHRKQDPQLPRLGHHTQLPPR